MLGHLIHRLTDERAGLRNACTPTNPGISLFALLELTQQADKLRRQRSVGDVNGRGTKHVADRVEDYVVDVFCVVGKTERARATGPQHRCFIFPPALEQKI